MSLKAYAAAVLLYATMQPAVADPFDPCLVGSWQADPVAFGQALAGAMGGGTAQMTSGQIVLDVLPSGVAFMDVSAVVIDLQAPGAPPSVLRMEGASSTQMNTAGISFWVDVTEYSIHATAEVMGMVMDVPVAGTDPGTAAGTYRCSADELAFMVDNPYPSIAPVWHRID